MNRFGLCKVLAVTILIASPSLGGRVAGAPQEPSSQEPSAPVLVLSSDSQSPGNVALISLSLRFPDGVLIGKAESEVTYPGKVLVFEEARRGLSAEAVEAKVTAVAQEPKGDSSIVRVTIAAKEGVPLPPGVLAELRFKILEQAPKETKVALKNKAFAWSDKIPPTPIEATTGKDGEVEITANAPLIACFFYMH